MDLPWSDPVRMSKRTTAPSRHSLYLLHLLYQCNFFIPSGGSVADTSIGSFVYIIDVEIPFLLVHNSSLSIPYHHPCVYNLSPIDCLYCIGIYRLSYYPVKRGFISFFSFRFGMRVFPSCQVRYPSRRLTFVKSLLARNSLPFPIPVWAQFVLSSHQSPR
jgi:hypothetical protein